VPVFSSPKKLTFFFSHFNQHSNIRVNSALPSKIRNGMFSRFVEEKTGMGTGTKAVNNATMPCGGYISLTGLEIKTTKHGEKLERD
jgi:hypothetical protein